MTMAKACEKTPARRLSWTPIHLRGRQIGTLASMGSGYVFYARLPALRAFDGCHFADRDEAEAVVLRAARRLAAHGSEEEERAAS